MGDKGWHTCLFPTEMPSHPDRYGQRVFGATDTFLPEATKTLL